MPIDTEVEMVVKACNINPAQARDRDHRRRLRALMDSAQCSFAPASEAPVPLDTVRGG